MPHRALILAVLAALSLPASARATGPGLALGFSGVTDFTRVVAVGGSVARLDAGWPAGTKPAHPTHPSDPAYDFSALDRNARQAHAHGLRFIVTSSFAPLWAQGAGRPTSVVDGVWRPDPVALAKYSAALARRYSGRYPDPLDPGRTLPRAMAFQVWNEPNLAFYLAPQWRRVKGHWVINSPAMYRRMLNLSYAAIHRVDAKARVVAAGLAPYGDLGPDHPSYAGQRIQPARFWRELLSRPVHFDAWDHHPYPIAGPFRKALNPDDVSIDDLGKLTRPLRAAERAGRVFPRGGRQPLWITEVSWDSSPPDPHGVPVRTQARWMSQAFYLLWRQGASLVTWYHDTDEGKDVYGRYSGTYQSGVFYLDGRPKPSAQAFRFPMTAFARGPHRTLVWARSPAAGRLVFEKRSGPGWGTVAAVRVRRGQVVQRVVAHNGTSGLRARVGEITSLVT